MYSEEDYTVRRPVVPYNDMMSAGHRVAEGMTLLSGKPSGSVLRAAEMIGRYMRREFGYDFPMFTARAWPVRGLYLLHETDYEQHPVWRFRVIGAVQVSPERWQSAERPIETLTWAWLHPFYRNRGVLRAAWKDLESRHGSMAVQPPLSPAMRAFLVGKQSGSVGTIALYGSASCKVKKQTQALEHEHE